MIVKKFRGEDFINRDKDIEYFLDYFKTNPKRILWVYGPKSTGKTTLIEYIVENTLLNDPSYNVKYISFRRKMVGNYDSFINSFITPKENEFLKDLKLSINLHFIKVDSKVYEKVKLKEIDFFEVIQEQFLNYSKNRKNILIIDEIQTLEDIYIDEGRVLLNEFLNFCISLTKEMHISHVVILTSNTIFLNKIYNNAKMKVTSDFKLIDHLPYKEIDKWLTFKDLGFRIADIELIYDYFGGSTAHIKKLLDNYKYFNSIEEYLKEEANIAKGEIEILIEQLKLSDEEIKKLYFVMEQIVKNGVFENSKYRGYLDIVSKFAEAEILFFDPLKNRTTANSRIYKKAYEMLLKEEKNANN